MARLSALDVAVATPKPRRTTQPKLSAYQIGMVIVGAFMSFGMMTLSRQPLTILIPLIAATLSAFLMRAPGVVFAAYLYIPFYKGIVDPVMPVDITPLLAVSCFLLAAPILLSKRERAFRSLRLAFSLWTVVLWLVILGVFYASDFELAFSKGVEFFLLVYLPCLLALRIAIEPGLQKQFLAATLTVSTIVIVMATIQLATIGTYDRVATLGTNTIGTGQAAILMALIGPAVYRRTPAIIRPLFIPLIPLGVVAATASGSRGPLFIGAISLIVVMVAFNHNRLRNAVLGAVAILAAALIIQLPTVQGIIPYAAMSRITVLLTAVVNLDMSMLDSSSAARLRLFDLAGQMFRSSPFVGHGTASFEATALRTPGFEIYVAPHNLPLHFAAEFGVVGVLVLGLVVVLAIRSAVRALHLPWTSPFIILGAFAAFYSLIDLDIYGSRWFWGVLLILLALPGDIVPEPDASPGYRRGLNA